MIDNRNQIKQYPGQKNVDPLIFFPGPCNGPGCRGWGPGPWIGPGPGWRGPGWGPGPWRGPGRGPGRRW